MTRYSNKNAKAAFSMILAEIKHCSQGNKALNNALSGPTVPKKEENSPGRYWRSGPTTKQGSCWEG